MKIIVVAILVFLNFGQTVEAGNWLTDFDAAKKMALATDRLVLVDFWASWCGPCKKMDMESWSKDEVKTLMDGYVPVQIDIDRNKHLANQYNVKGIPYIFILDGNGKVVYQSMSYKSKSQVIDLLETYAMSTQFLNKELISYYNKQNFVSAYRLATKYHDYTFYLDEDLRRDFLRTANDYFDEALDYLDKSDLKNKAALQQKIELYEIQKEIIVNNYKKALRLLSKINKEDVDKMNTSFFAFLNYAAYKLSENEEQAILWEAEVKKIDKQKVELLTKKTE
jgi:thioredoxin-like negative regulator of GroEL